MSPAGESKICAEQLTCVLHLTGHVELQEIPSRLLFGQLLKLKCISS